MLIELSFLISTVVFNVLDLAFPVPDMDQIDDVDVSDIFSTAELRRIRVVPLSEDASMAGSLARNKS
jgi:NCS1 family nucleobase:cation symporter-1